MPVKIFLLLVVLFGGGRAVNAGEDGIAAIVNGSPVANKFVNIEADRIASGSRFHSAPSDTDLKEFRRRSLEALIDQELAYQQGVSLGMKPDRKAVKKGMRRLREQFGSKKEYETALKKDGITEKELKSRLERDSVAVQAYARAVLEPSRLSDEALKAYYENNQDKFREPEKIRLRMISIAEEGKAGKALALLDTGENFGNVASRMSEDAYRIKGGDVGFIHKGRLVPELEEVAFGLQQGEISGLIKAEGKWFIIKQEGKQPSRMIPFDEIKEKLKKELETKRSKELKKKWLAGLRAKAKIEILNAY